MFGSAPLSGRSLSIRTELNRYIATEIPGRLHQLPAQLAQELKSVIFIIMKKLHLLVYRYT